MGVISNFALDVEKILFRSGPVFVRLSGDSSADWYSLGVLADPRVSWNPVTTSKENSGREHMLCADFSISFKMLQTSYGVELANIDSLVKKFVDVKMCDGRASLTDESAESMVSVPGIIISGASLLVSGELDFGGGESGIIVSFSFRITTDNIEEMHFGDSWVIDVDAAFDTPVLFAWQPEDDALTPYIGEGAGTFARNSIATYVDADGVIQQVTANAARYQDGGILLEPQRTNLVVRSNYGSGWTNSSATVVTGLADPMGGTGAFSVQDDSAVGYEYVYPATSTVTPGTAYSATVFIKKNAAATADAMVGVNANGGTTQNFYLFVDPRDGSYGVTGSPSAATSVNVETGKYFDAVGDEWYRAVVVFTPSASNVSCNLFLYGGCAVLGSGGGVALAENSTTTFFGIQLEAGSYPTTYIPTAGAAVTRVADSLTLPFTQGLPSEGMTVLAKGFYPNSVSGDFGLRIGSWAGTGATEYSVIVQHSTTARAGFEGASNPATVYCGGGTAFTLGVEDDLVAQIDVANNTIRTFNGSDVAQATAAIAATAGHTPDDNVISRSTGEVPFILTALIIVRGLLTPAQMRRFLR